MTRNTTPMSQTGCADQEEGASLHIAVLERRPIVRTGLATTLRKIPGVRVIRETSALDACLAGIARDRPDVVVAGTSLCRAHRVELCRALSRSLHRPRLLFLLEEGQMDFVHQVQKLPTAAFLSDSAEYADFDSAVSALALGRTFIDPRLTPSRLTSPSSSTPVESRPRLSPQELRIVALVAHGKTNREIAATLSLSDKTVKNYLANAFSKLHITRRTEAVSWYCHNAVS